MPKVNDTLWESKSNKLSDVISVFNEIITEHGDVFIVSCDNLTIFVKKASLCTEEEKNNSENILKTVLEMVK